MIIPSLHSSVCVFVCVCVVCVCACVRGWVGACVRACTLSCSKKLTIFTSVNKTKIDKPCIIFCNLQLTATLTIKFTYQSKWCGGLITLLVCG